MSSADDTYVDRERVKMHPKHEERWSYSNLNHFDEAFVLMFTWVITENSLYHLMFPNSAPHWMWSANDTL